MFFNKNKKETQGGQGAGKSTQSFLDVAEIRDGIIILRNGNLRSILAASSVNFALKSEDEQNAIVSSYQSFLNSVEFPIQILIQNRRMDVSPYLDFLKNRMASVTNQLMQMQMAEYIQFIEQLSESAHIMTKSFYVVVPYNVRTSKKGLFNRLGNVFGSGQSAVLEAKSFEEYKQKLMERTANIGQSLNSMGVNTTRLKTEEVIELLYSSYNVGSATSLHADALNQLNLGE